MKLFVTIFDDCDFLQSIFMIFLILFVFSLPFLVAQNSYCIAGMFCISVIHFLKNGKFKKAFHFNAFSIQFLIFYILNVVTLLYSEDIFTGFKELERKAAFVIFPLIFSVNSSLLLKKRELVLNTFLFSILFYSVATMWLVIWLDPNILNCSKWSYSLNFRNLYGNINNRFFIMHQTYFSMYVLFALFILFDKINNSMKFYHALLLIFFSFMLLIINCRITILAYLVVILFYIINFGFLKNLKYGFVLMLGIISFLTYLIYLSPDNRFLKELCDPKSYTLPRGIYHNSTNIRGAAILCSIENFIDNPLLGVGIGDRQSVLNQCYIDHNLSDVMVENNINSHCQYVEELLIGGILLFLSFILILFTLVFVSISEKSKILLNFSILLIFTLSTESILSSQKGVVFFVFFILLLSVESHFIKIKNIFAQKLDYAF